jgi:hypothetical protein
MEPSEIAANLTPLQISTLRDCCERGSTRTNDGGLIDTLLSGMCSNTAEGVFNGWLIEWSHNHPRPADDHYINRYSPTQLGRAVAAQGIVSREGEDAAAALVSEAN